MRAKKIAAVLVFWIFSMISYSTQGLNGVEKKISKDGKTELYITESINEEKKEEYKYEIYIKTETEDFNIYSINDKEKNLVKKKIYNNYSIFYFSSELDQAEIIIEREDKQEFANEMGIILYSGVYIVDEDGSLLEGKPEFKENNLVNINLKKSERYEIISIDNKPVVNEDSKELKSALSKDYKNLTIYYKSSFPKTYIEYSLNGTANKANDKMKQYLDTAYYEINLSLEDEDIDFVKFGFNDAHGHNDDRFGQLYIFDSNDTNVENITIENGKIYNRKPVVDIVVEPKVKIGISGNEITENELLIEAKDADKSTYTIYINEELKYEDKEFINSKNIDLNNLSDENSYEIKIIAKAENDNKKVSDEAQFTFYKTPELSSSLESGEIEEDITELTLYGEFSDNLEYTLSINDIEKENKSFENEEKINLDFNLESGDYIKLELKAVNGPAIITKNYVYTYKFDIPEIEISASLADGTIINNEKEIVTLYVKNAEEADYDLGINGMSDTSINYFNNGDKIEVMGYKKGDKLTLYLLARDKYGNTASKLYNYTYNYEEIKIEPNTSASPSSGELEEGDIIVLSLENSINANYKLKVNGKLVEEAEYENNDQVIISKYNSGDEIELSLIAETDIDSANNAYEEYTYTFKGEEEFSGIKIYFANDEGDTNIHYWGGDAGSSNWPGDTMEKYDDTWYYYEFEDASNTNFIPNWDGGQTSDLSIKEEGTYYVTKLTSEVNDEGKTIWTCNVTTEDSLVDTKAPIIKTKPLAGNYEENSLNVKLLIEDLDKDAKAYYTSDGTDPSIGENEYTNNIIISESSLIKVIAKDKENNISDIYEFDFKLGQDVKVPVVTPSLKPGNYEERQVVSFEIEDNEDDNVLSYYTIDGTDPKVSKQVYDGDTLALNDGDTLIKLYVKDSSDNEKTYIFKYYVGEKRARTDFREETVYFMMTTRFYDGDLFNTRKSPSYESSGNALYNDPSWRGDFKGLIQKLDYIKALGFTAIWITPPVLNRNYYDYHGYHAWDMTAIDGRLESPDATYQDLIDEIHKRDMKIMQDIVLNHSGRYGLKDKAEIKYFGDPSVPGWGTIPGGNEDDYIDYYDEYNPDFVYDGVTKEEKSGKSWYNGDLWQTEKPDLPWEAAEEFYWWEGTTFTHEDDLDNLWGKVSPFSSPEGYAVYHFQWPGMYESQFTLLDPNWFHRFWLKNWEDYTCQLGTIHEDCLDLDTESEVVQEYLIDAYSKYINMGVDAFRIDTVKHISRNTFNRRFNPAFHEAAAKSGNDNFYMAGEVCVRDHGVWNKGNASLSQPFYTWQERSEYTKEQWNPDWGPWEDRKIYSEDDLIAAKEAYDYESDELRSDKQPTSDNHLLDGNEYHEPDYSLFSGMNVIDFRMHWNFSDANTAFGVRGGDVYTNDATWNMTYVESHDYSPVEVGNSLYARVSDEKAMAENWSLMFTWRGIPTIFYGNEILFKGGEIIDEGPNRALEESGRAYFGDHIEGDVVVNDFGSYSSATGNMKETLEHPLATHLRSLNKLRHAIPALQKGQYSTEGVTGGIAFKKRYTNSSEGIDSFVLVTVSQDATFSDIPNGLYVDAVTGEAMEVNDNKATIECDGTGNLRVYVLDGLDTPAPGQIVEEFGKYIKK